MVSKGMTFFRAGEEMLRTKGGDENSYKSSDEVNNIDWSVLNDDTIHNDMILYYKGLIEMRKSLDIFTVITYEKQTEGRCTITFDDGKGGQALVISNPIGANIPTDLEGRWYMICDGFTVDLENPELVEGSLRLPTYGAVILVNAELLNR